MHARHGLGVSHTSQVLSALSLYPLCCDTLLALSLSTSKRNLTSLLHKRLSYYLCQISLKINLVSVCFSFEVKAVGNPKPTIRWYKQGTEIQPNKDFQVENFEDGTSVLTIMEIFPDDVGEISCEVQNELGVDQTATELQVHSKYTTHPLLYLYVII